MKTITAGQARRLDKKAREEYKMPSHILMENAGRAVAEEIIKLNKKKIAIICGKGNNGGDGFVCARHLLVAGQRVDIFLAGHPSEVKDDARLNLNILLNLGRKIKEINAKNIGSLKTRLGGYGLVVDAIFGVGFPA